MPDHFQIDTNIPCGNALRLRVEGDAVRFEADPHDAAQSMWWAFRVCGEVGQSVTCVQENTARVLGGGGLAAARPVVCADGLWRRLPASACAFDPERAEFRFRMRLPASETWVASCYPYGEAELEPLLRAVAAEPAGTVETLGESAGGRPVRLLRLAGAEGARAGVLLTARHHSGETPGSYALQGFLRRAWADDALGRRLRAVCDIRVLPWMDVDGVVEGRYGKDRPPVDFNRDWSAAPCRPEVRIAQEVLADLAARYDRLFFFDLHAPAPGNGNFLVPMNLTLRPRALTDATRSLAGAIVAECPAAAYLPAFSDGSGPMSWSLDLAEATATGYAARVHGAHALTLEASYHDQGDGRMNAPASWAALGVAFARGLDRFLRGQAPPAGPVKDETMARMLSAGPHWAFWQAPRGALQCTPDGFSLEGKDASVYITRGETRPVTPGGGLAVPFSCRLASAGPCDLRVRTLFYDARGARLPQVDEQSVVPPAGAPRRLTLSLRVPAGAASARPGWWVRGLTGRLEVTREA